MVKFKVKRGDRIIVTVGRDKGTIGMIEKVLPKLGRIIVSGVNIVTRHVRRSVEHPEGAILKKEASIDISNVMHIDPDTGKPTRVGYKINEDGKKVRYFKTSGKVLV